MRKADVAPTHAQSARIEPRPFDRAICVARPYLLPIAECCARLQEIWDNQGLTNTGPVLKRSRSLLSRYVGTGSACLFNNGTLALQLGLQETGMAGGVTTTPSTFVATTHARHGNRSCPAFADIEPDYYTTAPRMSRRR